MTSEEDVPPARTMSRGSSPEGNREWLSQEDTILIRSLCRAMRNADFKISKEDPWMTAAMPPVSTGPNISQAGSDRAGSRQVAGRSTVNKRPNDSNVASDNIEDREANQMGSGECVCLGTPAPETENYIDESNDFPDSGREHDKRPVAEQTTTVPDAEAEYTSRYHKLVNLLTPLLGLRGAEEKEEDKPEKDIPYKLYKSCKDVNDKLQLLENAISRLGGVGDVLSGIRQLRAALVIALRWENYVRIDRSFDRWNNFTKGVRNGNFDSPEKVMVEVRDWPNLQEDGTVFGSGSSLSGMRLLVEKVSESAEAMLNAFDELGTVNGCQFVSLCTILRAVLNETQDILLQIKRFASSKGLDAEELALELIRPKCTGLSDAMKSLSNEITDAINRDIPNLQKAEERITSKYTSMSATAAFFSGITATAIQITSTMTGSALKDAVNTVWFISLVFSVGSVIASLIGLTWLQSRIPMRTQEDTFKRGLIFLLRNGPTMLMTAAASTFLIGLALFVNSSNQARSTSIATSFFIAFVSVILIFLAVCFGLLYKGGVLSWSRSRLNSARTASWELWLRIALLIDLTIENSTQDPSRDLTEEFLAEPESGAEHASLSPSKAQVMFSGFSRYGPFPLAVVNSEKSSLTIFEEYEDSSPVKITVDPPLGEVKQLLWAPNNEHLLIRTSNSLSLWSEEESVCKLFFENPTTIQDVVWMRDSTTILAIERGVLIPINVNTTEVGERLPLHGIQVIAAQFLVKSNGGHLVCVADVTEGDNTPAVRKLLVMDHNTGDIIYSGTRIRTATSSLQTSAGDDKLTKALLSFTDGSGPQLWHLKQQNLISWDVNPKLKYNVGRYLCRSPAYFSGTSNELVVCAVSWSSLGPKADEIWVWSADDATKIHSIDIQRIHSGLPVHINWKVDEKWTLALTAAYDDGKLVKGEISFFDPIYHSGDLRMDESHVKVLEV